MKLLFLKLLYLKCTYCRCNKFFRSANSLLKALEDGDSESIEAATASLKESANEFFKEYDQVVDKKLFAAGMSAYYSISPKEYVPKIIIDAMDKYKCAPKWAKKLTKSPFLSTKKGLCRF